MVSTFCTTGTMDAMLQADIKIIRVSDGKVISIGTLYITNVGGDEHRGVYDLRYEEYSNGMPTQRTGRLPDYRRAAGAASLVCAALKWLGL